MEEEEEAKETIETTTTEGAVVVVVAMEEATVTVSSNRDMVIGRAAAITSREVVVIISRGNMRIGTSQVHREVSSPITGTIDRWEANSSSRLTGSILGGCSNRMEVVGDSTAVPITLHVQAILNMVVDHPQVRPQVILNRDMIPDSDHHLLSSKSAPSNSHRRPLLGPLSRNKLRN